VGVSGSLGVVVLRNWHFFGFGCVLSFLVSVSLWLLVCDSVVCWVVRGSVDLMYSEGAVFAVGVEDQLMLVVRGCFVL